VRLHLLQQHDRALVERWLQDGTLYVTPWGMNDDWFFFLIFFFCWTLYVTPWGMNDDWFGLCIYVSVWAKFWGRDNLLIFSHNFLSNTPPL